MKVLVTGANGQLGKELVLLLQDREGYEVLGAGREQMDLTSPEQVFETIRRFRPDVVIHTAAYTAVDLAETEEELAYRVNAFGTRDVARAAEEVGAKVCYISTDYVFDGNAKQAYREYDNTDPINVYGKSKRAGEWFVQSMSSKHFIVRTSWVYGLYGQNFVKTMLKLGAERDLLRVVDDQVGSPTYTADLAEFLARLIETDRYGIYHASNAGACSWCEFAKAIFEESGIAVRVEPCTTDEFPRPAARPKHSVMEHLSIRANGFEDLPPWRDGLSRFLESYRTTGGA